MNQDKEDNNVIRQEAAKRLASLGGKAPDIEFEPPRAYIVTRQPDFQE